MAGSQAQVEIEASPAAVRRPSNLVLYGLLGLMLLFWSLNYTAGKIALRELPPLLVSGWRMFMAAILMAPVYAWSAARGGSGQRKWRREDVPRLVIVGFLGVAVNQLCFVLGLSWTSVAHAAILAGLIPAMVLLIAAAQGIERLSAAKLLGMAVALAGVGALHIYPEHGAHATVIGDLMIVSSALAFALFSVYGKQISTEVGAVTVNAFAYAAGAVGLVPVVLWQSQGFAYGRVSPAAWAAVLFMAAFPSVLCYVIYSWALRYMRASRVSMVTYFQPVLSILLAVPLLGERVTAGVVAGGVLVLAGVYLAERR